MTLTLVTRTYSKDCKDYSKHKRHQKNNTLKRQKWLHLTGIISEHLMQGALLVILCRPTFKLTEQILQRPQSCFLIIHKWTNMIKPLSI